MPLKWFLLIVVAVILAAALTVWLVTGQLVAGPNWLVAIIALIAAVLLRVVRFQHRDN